MLGFILRFLSGLVTGIPVAVIAYYILPLVVADITLTHIVFISAIAATVGVLRPSLLLKGIAATYMWRNG